MCIRDSPYSPTSPYGKFPWPDHVHIFTQAAPARVEVPQLGAVVYGSAFTSLYRMDSPLAGFHAQEEDLAAFGCFHGDLSSAHSRYGPITHNEIAASGLHYLALGHSHSASGLKRAGKTYYAWPGCPEGRGFDETGDKGVYLGQLEGGRVSLDFVPLARRRDVYKRQAYCCRSRSGRTCLPTAPLHNSGNKSCRRLQSGQS